jgi:hypothetical protein
MMLPKYVALYGFLAAAPTIKPTAQLEGESEPLGAEILTIQIYQRRQSRVEETNAAVRTAKEPLDQEAWEY